MRIKICLAIFYFDVFTSNIYLLNNTSRKFTYVLWDQQGTRKTTFFRPKIIRVPILFHEIRLKYQIRNLNPMCLK